MPSTPCEGRPFQRPQACFSGMTQEMRRRQEREAFALRLAPVLRELHDAGLSNRELAEELNRRGVASENGRPWTLQGVAAVRLRLAQLVPALPPRPRGWGRRIPPATESCG